MTEVIYHSDSISKTITIFAIECAIIFGFILITLFNLLELLILSCNVRKEVNLFCMSPFINTLIGAVMYLWIV